ncbi:MAG: OmpA family protein [Hyphomonadaceae bacterium JAD_PAG50586_4]|nr:MAG: OmpA family protein [Hyphomonadaceae bacterium JAD_PAG50586_4]
MQARAALDEQAIWLNRFDQVDVTVVGHAADEGAEGHISASYALALGQRRAASVRDYLVSRGVGAQRIETVSMGITDPIDADDTALADARNRRVEVTPRAPRSSVTLLVDAALSALQRQPRYMELVRATPGAVFSVGYTANQTSDETLSTDESTSRLVQLLNEIRSGRAGGGVSAGP